MSLAWFYAHHPQANNKNSNNNNYKTKKYSKKYIISLSQQMIKKMINDNSAILQYWQRSLSSLDQVITDIPIMLVFLLTIKAVPYC